MKKMNLKRIFNWLYAKTLDRAMTERQPREERETISPVYRLVCVSYLSAFLSSMCSQWGLLALARRIYSSKDNSVCLSRCGWSASRTMLVSLFLLVLGGWNTQACGAEEACTYTISNKKSSITTYQSHKKKGWFDSDKYKFYANNEIGSIDNQYGISKIYIKATMERIAFGSGCKIKFQYKNASGSWENLTSEKELDGYTASAGSSTLECNISGGNLTSDMSGATAFRIVETRREEYNSTRTITINSFYVVMAKTLSGSTDAMTFSNQTYNTTSSAKTREFTFSNEVTGKSITISENTNSTEFPATLTKSGDCTGSVTVSVKFKPSAQGDRSGSITVSGDCGSKTFSVSGTGLRANSSLEMNDGEVNVSIEEINSSTLDLSTLLKSKTGNGGITYEVQSATGENATTSTASIAADGKTFSATECGTYTIRATQAQTDQYNSSYDDFTVTVNKLQPTFTWKSFDHIYASDELENVAQAKYNGNNVNGLTYTYTSGNSIVVVDGTTLKVQNAGFTVATNVTISVATEGTPYYEEGSDSHTYLIEPKATPEFWLNETINLPASPIQKLYLLVGETATMSFVNTDESNNRFTYPTNPTYVSYEHNSSEHTGVITAVKAGDEEIQFHQTGTSTIFDHLRSIHVYVSKHEVNLATTLDGGTWKVDSIYDGAVYSIVTPTGDQPVLSEVSVTSSNDAVLKKVNGHWKAVGEGEATLTITHPSTNDYWASQTIEAHITVVKHTPEITWNLDASYPWGAIIESPVSSSNEELPFTITSNYPEIADYVNGQIYVYNKTGNVKFTLTQAGNDKWNAAASNLTKTISVYKPNNHVPFTISNNNKGDLVITTANKAKWDNNGYKMGDNKWVLNNAPNSYIIIALTGVPDKLSFTKVCERWGLNLPVDGDCLFEVYESSTNGNWGEPIWSYNKQEESRNVSNIQISPSTQFIKLRYYGTVYGHFNNIQITERHEIVATPSSYTFPTADVDASAQTLPVQIDWYNVKTCTATIEGANAGFFQLAETEPIAASLDHFGTETLHVTYAYPQAGTHTATLKVESEDGYKVEVPLSATSLKVTPAITWKENLSPMQRGIDVADPATSPVDLTYSSSDETVVAVESNVLKPLKKGEATITASFDGTSDLKWNSANCTIDVVVTDMKVQHINWTQTFTRLKYTTDPVLSSKNTQPFALEATVSYYDADAAEEVILDRLISFTSGDESVVKVIKGKLHVVGLGETTLTAHVEGIADSLFEATVVRPVKVHEPTADCEAWVLENKSGSINTISSKEFTLNGEGDSIYFDAWREPIKVVIEYSAGDLYLAEVYENGSENTIWHNKTQKNTPTSYKCAISREAKKVKFYTVVGATGYHNFSDVYVRRARYVELENTKGKTTHSVHFSTEDAKPGVAKTKSFTVNYSNITDQLEMELKGGESSKFSVVSPASKTIGNECGDKGNATVEVQFLSNEVETYKDTLVIHNLNQSVEVYLSAEVDKHHQQITWNPATTELKTTDVVSFDATTSAAAAGLRVRYEVVEGDAATVNAETGALTIVKDGNVTIKATAAGNNSYYDAEPVSKTFSISKVTPTITTNPTAATMTLPNTNLSGCGLAGGVASVDGTFAWEDNTINATLNNAGYTVIFTPENTNWYSTNSCIVVVPVNKTAQAIVWDFDQLEMFCNAQVTFDAHSNSGLAELPVSYSSSDESIAYVDGNNHLNIIKGGEVTITATQGGNAIYAAAEPVSKTLTINRFAPTIVTLPNASKMKIGRVLSDASLTGGRAELDGVKVEGSFAWVDGNTTVMDVAGTFSKQVVFTPANTNYYEPVYDQKSVTVEKYAPEIVQTLHGSDITYGQPLSVSNLTGTLTATDIIKIPSVEVEGTFAWLQPSAVLNAGSQSAKVRFTPANMDWYEVVDFPVQLNVNKASTEGLTVTGVSEIFYGQILGEAVPENTTVDPIHGGVVAGTMVWNASLNLNEYMEVGSHNLSVTFTVNDPNYISATLDGTAVLTVQAGYVFNGNDGQSKTWGEDTNWQGNEAPDGNEKVVILADVDIDSPVSVDAITIKEGVTVRVKEGAVLTIGNSDSFVRSSYGNLYVENGGKVIFGEGEMKVKDFVLEAQLGDNTNANPASSGQVSGAEQLKVTGDAYFRISFDPRGAIDYGWYDFTVPFEVDALSGVYDANGNKLTYNSDYAVMDFSEEKRAVNGKYWNWFSGTLQPNKLYSITFDDEKNWNTFLFKRKSVTANFGGDAYNASYSENGETKDRGWNGMGNGTLHHCQLNNLPEQTKIQVYDHANDRYVERDADEYTYAVGTAFFVQVDEEKEIDLTAVELTAEDANNVADYLWVSASEEATGDYVIGRDLIKMGTPTNAKVAQMWTTNNGLTLCDIEMPLIANKANTNVSFFAPQSGLYEIAVERAPEDATLYLTKNGKVIWNLSMNPCKLNLEKGTTEGYGLRIVAREQTPTDIENVDSFGGENVRKVMIDNVIYIVTPEGKMYDIIGKSVKY